MVDGSNSNSVIHKKSTMIQSITLAALLLLVQNVSSFTTPATSTTVTRTVAPTVQSKWASTSTPTSTFPLCMSTATPEQDTPTTNDYSSDDDETSLTSKGLLKRDRYVATNRFAVRKDKGAKFEARWANRKSRLSELDGFKYFHLMRRVTLNDDGSTSYDEGDKSDGSNMGNYVSFTIWEKKSHFSAWRKGEAFKEAHGGTSIGK